MAHDLEELSLDTHLAWTAARRRLNDEFEGKVGAETVKQVLKASWDHIDAGARIKNHVPLLAERFARGQLWALARMNGIHNGTPAILFIDTHDAGRAKMAKAMLMEGREHDVLALTAGTDPDLEVVPAVLEVMHERGLSLEQSFPKPFTEEMLKAADLIVTFCECSKVPLPSETEHEHWEYPEPSEMSVDEVRALRDQLQERVDRLVERLPTLGSGSAAEAAAVG